ncbi:ABC transporter substrate-binding protein [Pseudooceanicola algae]|uniref:Heme-binding protein A n=1 Tax=Pseudooceanicola algae TaxID=1537215 RepID=A0A418SCM9_9RHOB|nr:ABC transporter substrate-binding protein [Pseudooceanicola algae]QPM92272.1 Heme-binding protein A [Pseudooceanicola algae]
MMKRTCAALSVAMMGLVAPATHAAPDDDTLVWVTNREANVPLVWWENLIDIAAMQHHFFDTLVYRNPETMEYEPLLATSWERIDDLTLEFKLRPGVVFHDGSAFDADDVVVSYSHLINPDSHVMNSSLVNWISSVEKVDDMTIRLHTAHPFPAAFEFLSSTRMGVMPSEVWENPPMTADGTPDYANMPVIGTGPYKMVSFVPGGDMILERFEDYYDGPKGQPAIKTLQMKTILDSETAIAELMVGQVDWVTGLTQDAVDSLRPIPGLEVLDGPDMRVSYLQLDATGRSGDTPIADLKVRQAIAHAIDKGSIARNLVGPAAQVLNAGCYPTQVGCSQEVEPYAYDPEQAKALLAEAGYGDGIQITIDAYRDRYLLEAILGNLAEVGIDADINMLQWAGLRSKMNDGEVEVVQTGWASSGLNDISGIASVLLKMTPDDSCQNPKVKELLDKADITIDTELRAATYKEALDTIAAEVCWIPLYSHSKPYAYNEALDFFPTADGFPLFFLASWD